MHEGGQIRPHLRRQRGLLEADGDGPIVLGGQGERQQVVLLQEAVEDVGAQHCRAGHRQARPVHRQLQVALAHEVMHEGQSAALAAQRAAADTQEGAGRIEVAGIEMLHLTAAAAGAEGEHGLHQEVPHLLDAPEVAQAQAP